MVRAKFRVTSKNEDGDLTTIILMPVCDGSEENKTFWKYTPSGEIKLGCCNPAASEKFVENAEYYVDFTKAASD